MSRTYDNSRDFKAAQLRRDAALFGVDEYGRVQYDVVTEEPQWMTDAAARKVAIERAYVAARRDGMDPDQAHEHCERLFGRDKYGTVKVNVEAWQDDDGSEEALNEIAANLGC